MTTVHRHGLFETCVDLDLPASVDVLRDVEVEGQFTSPTGRSFAAPGFWDGGTTWRVRFSPAEPGDWQYRLVVRGSAQSSPGSVQSFSCVPYDANSPLYRHGPPRVADTRAHLEHSDGKPFFWLADTVWNGPMLSTTEDWDHYLRVRREQGFTVAQFVSTSWRTAPDGGPEGPTYTRDGADGPIRSLNPRFFQHMDARFAATAEAGLVSAPVLLWAISGGENAEANPGFSLSKDDCVLLARYQIARWHAFPVIWILNGDGRYTGENAERWRRIGRRVFAERLAESDTTEWAPDPIPVAAHPGGKQWVGTEFAGEPWLDIVGYQSGHGDDDATWRWLVQGPPATQWSEVSSKAVINLEPPYECHLAYHSRQPHSPLNVRRACYWSLLVSPTAGVTYGGHGVWGWDDGSGPPVAHPKTGTPLPWRQALEMPGAQQMRHLRDLFESIPWHTLRPDQSFLQAQPGDHDVLRYVTAARSPDGRLAVLYLPAGGPITLDTTHLAPNLRATWHNPRDGSHHPVGPLPSHNPSLTAPDEHDWLLIIRSS